MNCFKSKSFMSRFGILSLMAIIFMVSANMAFAMPQIQLYEAENGQLSGGAQVSYRQVEGVRFCRFGTCYYGYDYTASGNAYVSGLTTAGSKVTFTVEAPYSREYKLSIAYTTPSTQDSSLTLQVQDSASNLVTPQRKVNFPAVIYGPNSTRYDSRFDFKERYEFVRLTQGSNTITLERSADDNGEVYLDYINTIPLEVIDTNSISNPGFESGSTDGWNEWHPDGQAAAYGVDGNDAHSGTNKLFFWSETPYQQSVSQNLKYTDHLGTYEISAWVKLQSYSGEQPTVAQMEISDYHGLQKTIPIPVSSEWTQIKTLVKVENILGYKVGFYLNAPGFTSLQVDDVSAKPLLANGSFDYGHIQGWTEWHPEGQEAKFGVDKLNSDQRDSMPASGPYKLYFFNDQPYQQSVHQKVTGLENGTYKVDAQVKLITYDWQNDQTKPYVTVARMEIADHGSEQLNVTIPEAQRSINLYYYDYQQISATFDVTSGQLDLGFYLNALEKNTSMQIDKIELVKIQ